MKWLEKFIKKFYGHKHNRQVIVCSKEFKSFSECFRCNVVVKLGSAVPGVYVFVASYCSRKFGYRLLEMGFVTGEELTVIVNTGHNGSVVVKVKGSKIALSSRIADKILLKVRCVLHAHD
jgi:Fe2+ transport system protein FeoA